MTPVAFLIISLFAASAVWLAYALPGLILFTGSVVEACQSILVMCVEALSLGKLFFFWSGALLAISGLVYASARASYDMARTRRAIKRLPLFDMGKEVVLIRDSNLKAAFTHGLCRPRVYISTGLMKGLSNKELRAVFLHELNHKRKKDPLRFLALGFLKDAFFYIPAAPVLASFSRLRREHEADDAAARSPGGPVSVASAVLKLARTGLPLPVPSITGSQEQVSGRIRRLLDGKAPSFSVSPSKVAVSLLMAAAITASLSMPLHAGFQAGHECTLDRCSMHVDRLDNCRTHCSDKHDH